MLMIIDFKNRFFFFPLQKSGNRLNQTQIENRKKLAIHYTTYIFIYKLISYLGTSLCLVKK